MPRKSRTPSLPRPVKAPKQREQPRRDWRSSKWTLALIGGVLAAGVIAVLATTLSSGGGTPAKKLAAAGCTFKTYPDLGANHVQSLDANVKYNSFPPTSGPHYSRPAIWGSYNAPLVLVQEVHNLEHGGVIIQYGSRVSRATVEQLQPFYSDSPNGLLLAALPKLGNRIALTAWTHLATCRRFDESAFRAFRDAYRGKGPERFPVSALKPGT